MEIRKLIEQAKEAMKNAYAPYSGYKVGAALLSAGGKIYLGCNVENAAYSPTNCAERTAFFKAVSDGERQFKAIAIAGGREGTIRGAFPPCGVCRQVMQEFCDPETFKIIVAKQNDEYDVYTLGELLPYGFGRNNLRKT